MSHYYTCEHFSIKEFVPEVVWMDRGEKAWQLMDLHLLENWDSLRDQLGCTITLNNWSWGGERQASVLRIAGQPHYTAYSQHTFGRAGDGLLEEITAEEVRTRIKKRDIILPHPVIFEVDVGWIHMDTRQSTDMVTFVNLKEVVWTYRGD